MVKFLGCFFMLYYFYPAYRGVIGPGGKIYFPFIEEHFNLIVGFTKLLVGSAKLLLEGVGYELYQKDYHSLKIGYSKGISVNPSCLGWAVMSFWSAFVFANKGNLKHKLKWLLGGIISIILLNIIRISLITLAGHLNWEAVFKLDPHKTFNVASYTCIMILIGCYIRNLKTYERNEFDGKHPRSHKFSTV